MRVKLELAGIPVEINTLYTSLTEHCRDYITDKSPLFTVTTSADDIAAEREKSIAECAYEGIEYPAYSPAELENTAVYRKIAMKLPEYDAFVFHGSAIGVGDKAYLFTAPSGTGKTTHTSLWLKNIDGSYIINGDKPILRVTDDKVFVCGTPWMGKEALGCSAAVPLDGLCFLNRGEKNTIQKVSFRDVMPRLIGQSFRPPEMSLYLKTIKLIEKTADRTPLYELFCNMEDDAALTAYRGMCR